MSVAPYLLVVLSAVAHAYWNFLLKRSRGGQLFVGLSKLGEVALFAPVFVVVGLREAVGHASLLMPLAVVGAALTLTNYVMLAFAYGRGDLSLVYPISRGAVLLFLPFLGYLVFGERIGVVGGAALALIVVGIIVLSLPSVSWAALAGLSSHVTRSGVIGFALLAAAAAASYTVWDKRSIGLISPFTYFYSYTVLVAAAYGAHIVRRYPWATVRAEWSQHRWAIMQVAFFNTFAYWLVLLALRSGTSSYVIALRQLSVVFGALLGWRLLGEQLGRPKRLGIALLVGGTMLVALAR